MIFCYYKFSLVIGPHSNAAYCFHIIYCYQNVQGFAPVKGSLLFMLMA